MHTPIGAISSLQEKVWTGTLLKEIYAESVPAAAIKNESTVFAEKITPSIRLVSRHISGWSKLR